MNNGNTYDIGYCPELDITILLEDVINLETEEIVSSEIVYFLYGKVDFDEIYEEYITYGKQTKAQY